MKDRRLYSVNMQDYKELLEKFQALLAQNEALKKENESLKARLLGAESGKAERRTQSNTLEKIRLFMSLFSGRDDVYSKRWENREGKSGYAPVCLNEWKSGLCRKPAAKCSECRNKSYAALNEIVIEDHLRGNIVVGIYPLRQDETCNFLAIDFDDEDWQKDVSTLRDICKDVDIPVAIERSRSGNGAHAWFFFSDPISAGIARKLGTALLTYAMGMRHEITFKSYDRFFPNQDTMPKGGFGNLIALPLQKKAREKGASVFIDESFHPYDNQWEFLAELRRLSESDIGVLISKLCHGNELGALKNDDEGEVRPWEPCLIKWSKTDFPISVELVRANMLYINKSNISQRGLNALKRLAAFKNPDFYRAQAMRMPTYNKPRIISCSDETPEYLYLPRGCEADVINLLAEAGSESILSDHTNSGKCINATFRGELREEQDLSLVEMLKHDHGVLSATTAFGKTVVAAGLIAKRKTNTLILVHRQQLLSQWASKLSEFLMIDEELPALAKKRGRKKKQSLIGQIGAGKDNPGGIVDIAIMQSLNNGGEIKDLVRNYGMLIVDECHHVPAFSFEQILKTINAKYVYGLTATPARQDGHHPIIFMYCGPVRYRVDARAQAEKRPFTHHIIPRFTGFRIPFEQDEKGVSIQELYSRITKDEFRNQLIVDDVFKNHEEGRHSLVLTERTSHVELLAEMLNKNIPDVMTLTGGSKAKEKREILARITSAPADRQLTMVATGKYIGEGFDEPRLDTLFLAMPISWKGTLQQYAGRLHRLYENKKDVRIYDYVDIHVKMLEKMYGKRLAGYASIGYCAKAESPGDESVNIIFDKSNFLPVFSNDLMNVSKEIVIISPFVTKRRTVHMLQYMNIALEKKVKVIVVTRPASDFNDKNRSALEEALGLLEKAGIQLVFKPNIHQKFSLLDKRIVWYGSINLLSFGSAEESIMRLNSPNIAYELMKSVIEF
jgi:superfamily II DNA or RNA helicase